MLRLTLILCIGMFATLMIAGEDRGQMRPGLADAQARKVVVEPTAIAATETNQASAIELAEAAPEGAPPAEAEDPAPVLASLGAVSPEPYVEPERELVLELEDPIFSLASLGNEVVPTGAEPGATAPQPETLAGGVGTIWYVNARSVNVRAEPSTSAEIVGRLASGEAALVVQAISSDWAQIVIQGDGVEGYVAMRYLSAEAP